VISVTLLDDPAMVSGRVQAVTGRPVDGVRSMR
jgi:hypothetical protein